MWCWWSGAAQEGAAAVWLARLGHAATCSVIPLPPCRCAATGASHPTRAGCWKSSAYASSRSMYVAWHSMCDCECFCRLLQDGGGSGGRGRRPDPQQATLTCCLLQNCFGLSADIPMVRCAAWPCNFGSIRNADGKPVSSVMYCSAAQLRCLLVRPTPRGIHLPRLQVPDPAPMTSWAGQPLTHELAEDIFIGWLVGVTGPGWWTAGLLWAVLATGFPREAAATHRPCGWPTCRMETPPPPWTSSGKATPSPSPGACLLGEAGSCRGPYTPGCLAALGARLPPCWLRWAPDCRPAVSAFTAAKTLPTTSFRVNFSFSTEAKAGEACGMTQHSRCGPALLSCPKHLCRLGCCTGWRAFHPHSPHP